jgi:hypothetical protein
MGRVYQQTFIATYTKVACAKLYDRKTPITAADLLNDRVLPFFDSQQTAGHSNRSRQRVLRQAAIFSNQLRTIAPCPRSRSSSEPSSPGATYSAKLFRAVTFSVIKFFAAFP